MPLKNIIFDFTEVCEKVFTKKNVMKTLQASYMFTFSTTDAKDPWSTGRKGKEREAGL